MYINSDSGASSLSCGHSNNRKCEEFGDLDSKMDSLIIHSCLYVYGQSATDIVTMQGIHDDEGICVSYHKVECYTHVLRRCSLACILSTLDTMLLSANS